MDVSDLLHAPAALSPGKVNCGMEHTEQKTGTAANVLRNLEIWNCGSHPHFMRTQRGGHIHRSSSMFRLRNYWTDLDQIWHWKGSILQVTVNVKVKLSLCLT